MEIEFNEDTSVKPFNSVIHLQIGLISFRGYF